MNDEFKFYYLSYSSFIIKDIECACYVVDNHNMVDIVSWQSFKPWSISVLYGLHWVFYFIGFNYLLFLVVVVEHCIYLFTILVYFIVLGAILVCLQMCC